MSCRLRPNSGRVGTKTTAYVGQSAIVYNTILSLFPWGLIWVICKVEWEFSKKLSNNFRKWRITSIWGCIGNTKNSDVLFWCKYEVSLFCNILQSKIEAIEPVLGMASTMGPWFIDRVMKKVRFVMHINLRWTWNCPKYLLTVTKRSQVDVHYKTS